MTTTPLRDKIEKIFLKHQSVDPHYGSYLDHNQWDAVEDALEKLVKREVKKRTGGKKTPGRAPEVGKCSRCKAYGRLWPIWDESLCCMECYYEVMD